MHNDLPFNFVRLLGNLGQDPEVTTSGKTTSARFSIAVASGKNYEKTNWFPCVAFKETANKVGEELQKGSRVIIEGKLSEDRWQNQEGENRRKAEVIVFEYEIQERREKTKDSVPESQEDNII